VVVILLMQTWEVTIIFFVFNNNKNVDSEAVLDLCSCDIFLTYKERINAFCFQPNIICQISFFFLNLIGFDKCN
jgi:hypothetical protein